MRIGLLMVVRNEEHNLRKNLAPIRDYFENIVVVDTGSTDGTIALLSQLNVQVIQCEIKSGKCDSLSTIRNLGAMHLSPPWILQLDADENIHPDHVNTLLNMPDNDLFHGYFLPWNTFDIATDQWIEDYKLCLFRKGIRSRGLIHENMQTDIRFKGHLAGWLPDLPVSHYPDPGLTEHKKYWYRERLQCAIEKNPYWHRYHWFLGYSLFLEGRLYDAIEQLERAINSNNPLFPVELLNSQMILACIYARLEQPKACLSALYSLRQAYLSNSVDFEVQVNHRLSAWIENAIGSCEQKRLDSIQAYCFGN